MYGEREHVGFPALSVTASTAMRIVSSSSISDNEVRSSWSYPWIPMPCPDTWEQSIVSAVLPSMKNVPFIPRTSSMSVVFLSPLSEEPKRGAVPAPLSMDPASFRPGICMLTSLSTSTV